MRIGSKTPAFMGAKYYWGNTSQIKYKPSRIVKFC